MIEILKCKCGEDAVLLRYAKGGGMARCKCGVVRYLKKPELERLDMPQPPPPPSRPVNEPPEPPPALKKNGTTLFEDAIAWWTGAKRDE